MIRSTAIASIVLLLVGFAPSHAAAQPAATRSSASEIEAATRRLVNRHRASLGLEPFAYDADVAFLAREHSENMGRGKVPFGHAGFEARVERADRGTSAAENVAYSTRAELAAADALKSWLRSRGHRENLEGDRLVTGIGAAIGSDGKIYITQLFFRR